MDKRSGVYARSCFESQPRHPNAPNPRLTEVNAICSQIEAEQRVIDSALAEAKRLLNENQLNDARQVCVVQLEKYPSNEHFLHLQFEIEEAQREALATAIRETEVLLCAEPDLLKQERLLEARNREFPDESHFRQALERTRKVRTVVDDIAVRARGFGWR